MEKTGMELKRGTSDDDIWIEQGVYKSWESMTRWKIPVRRGMEAQGWTGRRVVKAMKYYSVENWSY
jgi:hypothetical protein